MNYLVYTMGHPPETAHQRQCVVHTKLEARKLALDNHCDWKLLSVRQGDLQMCPGCGDDLVPADFKGSDVCEECQGPDKKKATAQDLIQKFNPRLGDLSDD